MAKPGPELLTRLLDAYGARLVLYARQWCRAPEDVVQEAFVQLMREQAVPENVVAWLFRVVRNRAISASRSQARRTRHETAARRDAEPWFVPQVEEQLDAAALGAALANLPLEQRETIVLRIWGEMSLEQIAEITQTSTSTAHRRFVSGLTALRAGDLACVTKKNRQK